MAAKLSRASRTLVDLRAILPAVIRLLGLSLVCLALTACFDFQKLSSQYGSGACGAPGCACTDDTTCNAGDVCVVTSGTGVCTQGCDATSCGAGQACCSNECVVGACCGKADCPADKVCNAQHQCASCMSDNDCRSGDRCCMGAMGQNACVTGACCTDGDCAAGQHCAGNACHAACDVMGNGCPVGLLCCSKSCYSGTCCTSADCSGGQICVKNQCTRCTVDADCGAGALCMNGACASGCNGVSPCGAASICCTAQNTNCKPGMAGCSGLCSKGACCQTSDCAAGQTCGPDHACHSSCSTSCGAGQSCCSSLCYVGNCCTSSDCNAGFACINNTCGPCTSDAQCGTGAVCTAGKCVSGCSNVARCAGGSVCCGAQGLCGAGGSACSGSCSSGTCCKDSDCSGGQKCGADHVCHTPCTGSCAAGQKCCSSLCVVGTCCAASDCMAGQLCLNNLCAACTNTSQCPAGNVCTAGACVPGCDGTVGCGAGSICCSSGGSKCSQGQTCAGTCSTGMCCNAGDCVGAEGCGPDHTCHARCTTSAQCSGGKCCGGFCYAGACTSTLTGTGLMGAPDAVLGGTYINGASSMVLDGSGNPFFIDVHSTSVRVANLGSTTLGRVGAGVVGRVAGGTWGCNPGPALLAEMGQPFGLTRDPRGNLYVADLAAEVVWKISADLSTVTLVAGTCFTPGYKDGPGASAQFNGLTGITYGVDNFLYTAELYNHRVRQIDPSTGVVKTLAGDGTGADRDGPAATAEFNQPGALVMDSSGTLFVGEGAGQSVRSVSGIAGGNAVVATIFPGPMGIVTYGGGLAISGNTIYASLYNNGIFALTPPGAGTTYTARRFGPAQLTGVWSVAVAGSSVWVGGWLDSSGPRNNQLTQLDLSGNVLQTLGQAQTQTSLDGAPSQATFILGNCFGGLATDGSGNAWVADRCTQKIRRVAVDGTVTSYGSGITGELGGMASAAQFCYPSGITVVGNSVFVVNSGCGRRLLRIDSGSGNVALLQAVCVTGEPGCVQPSPVGGLAADSAGNLYLTTTLEDGGTPAAMVVKIPSLGTGKPAFFAGTRGTTAAQKGACQDGALGTAVFGTYPSQLAVDASDTIYVADGTCGLRKITQAGVVSTLNGSTGYVGVTVAPKAGGGQVLAASPVSGQTLQTIDLVSGKATPLAGTSSGWSYARHVADGPNTQSLLWAPWNLASDAQGDILVLDVNNGRVRIVYP